MIAPGAGRVALAGHGLLALLAAWHLGLGSDLYLMGVMLAISAVGICRITAARVHFGDVFLFGLSLYSGLMPLLMKAGLGQPLQSNLHHPQAAATVLLAGFCAAWVCATIARSVAHPNQGVLGERLGEPALQRRLFLPLMAAGLCLFALHVTLRPTLVNGVLEQGAGFGGFGTLYFVLILGVAMGASLAVTTGEARYRIILGLVGAGMLALSVISNTKKEVFQFFLVLGIAAFAFGVRPSLRMMLGMGAVLAVIVLYVSPMIHLTRGAEDIGLTDRLVMAFDILRAHDFSAAQLRESEGWFVASFGYAFSESGSYIYPSTQNYDRFALILPIDQVLRGIDQTGTMGLRIFLPEILDGVLPSFLIAKNSVVGADLVAWEYGIRMYGNTARPVIGFSASALAAGGMLGVLLIPFFTILPLMMVANRLFGQLQGNMLAVFLAASSWILAEYTFDALAVFALRQFVVMTLFVWALGLLQRGQGVARMQVAGA